jgi:hypothetical protein
VRRIGFIAAWPVLVLLFLSSGTAQTGLIIVEPEFDFGLVTLNSRIAHGFKLVASRDDTVTVSDIKTGCGCIAVMPETLQIAPGDTGELILTWNTRQFRGETAKTAFVFTSLGPDPYRLTMRADCREDVMTDGRPIAASPSRVLFKGGATADSITQEVTFRNLTADKYEVEISSVTLVGAPDSALKLSVPEELGPSGIEPADFRIGQFDRNSSLYGSVTFTFIPIGANAYKLTIPVAGPGAISGRFSAGK